MPWDQKGVTKYNNTITPSRKSKTCALQSNLRQTLSAQPDNNPTENLRFGERGRCKK